MDLTATTDTKRIYVNTSFQLVYHSWDVLLYNTGLIIGSLFQLKKIRPRRNVSGQILIMIKTFPISSQSKLSIFLILEHVRTFCGNIWVEGYNLWRIWDVKISYCWGVIKTLLIWRTTLLLADCAWDKSYLRRKSFKKSWKCFSDFGQCLHRHASFCAGDDEDFSSALRPPELHLSVTL